MPFSINFHFAPDIKSQGLTKFYSVEDFYDFNADRWQRFLNNPQETNQHLTHFKSFFLFEKTEADRNRKNWIPICSSRRGKAE